MKGLDFHQPGTVKWCIAPEQVKQCTEGGKGKDNDNPWNFIGRIIRFTDQPDNDQNADDLQRLIDMEHTAL